MRLKKTLFSALLMAILVIPAGASADNLGFNTTILGQARQNQGNQNEVPLNGYLGLAYERPAWNLSAETDMRFFRDMARSWDDYDLYQAVVHIKPSNIVQIDFGRQFLSQGFSTDLVDGLKLTLRPALPVEFVTYTGIPRTVERGDFNKNDGLLSGVSIRFKDILRTSIQLHTAWRKANIRIGNARANDEVLVGADASYLFKGSWKPLLYGLAEFNATGKIVETGTAGLDIYPRDWAAFNVEFNYFDVDRNFNRPSILGLFAQGRILSGRIGSTWTLIPDTLTLEQSYSFQNIEVISGTRSNGHLLEVSLPVTLEKIRLSFSPGYYFSKSFGGDLHGVRLSAYEQFTDKFYAEAGVDYTTYNKVTGVNDDAFASGLWTGYEVLKGLTLSGGVEYNKNNQLGRDVRGSFKLQYNYGFKI